ncbi:MAG TPA: GerMN domain-containing protein [Mycobacteriales bacterium]|nr:GerMN domain-containing protein [Mycobacteriales bacterium]
MSTPIRTAAAVLCAALLLAGCGGDDPAAPPPPEPTTSPAATTPDTEPTTEPTDDQQETEARAVYYLRDVQPAGPRLYREFHARPATDDPVRDAVEAMLSEPPKDPDYTSLWPDGVDVLDVRVESGLATVDLSARAGEGSAGAVFEGVSLQQLVHTVTAADPSVQRVQLLVDGATRETLWGHVDVREPVERAPQAEILGPIWIIEPGEGGSVPTGGEVSGVATVFEATVSWQWVQDGRVVEEGFSTASEGAPGRGEWTAPVEVPPGDYELRAFSESAEDGSEMFVETKRVTVTG